MDGIPIEFDRGNDAGQKNFERDGLGPLGPREGVGRRSVRMPQQPYKRSSWVDIGVKLAAIVRIKPENWHHLLRTRRQGSPNPNKKVVVRS
jgi:hypothetical protein